MHKQLPLPLALRSFESAARHLSFTKAADELNVTQSAISHQVKALEVRLGIRLFTRLTRRLLLTNEGQILYRSVSEAFGNILKTIEEIGNAGAKDTLTVNLSTYFTAVWLSHRLSKFWNQHPDINLRLHHVAKPNKFDQSDIDILICWGDQRWPDVDRSLLFTCRVIPVCHPSIITPDKPLSTPQDLCHHTLLHEDDTLWSMWLDEVGVHGVDASKGPVLDDSNVLLQAAIDGHGIALGADLLLADKLEAKELIMPFAANISTLFPYYIAYRKGALNQPKIRAFHDWIITEAAQATKLSRNKPN